MHHVARLPRRIREMVTKMYPLIQRYARTDGSMVQDMLSQGADGDLYLTFCFEMTKHTTALSEAETAHIRETRLALVKLFVEAMLKVMREMVLDGRCDEFQKNAA